MCSSDLEVRHGVRGKRDWREKQGRLEQSGRSELEAQQGAGTLSHVGAGTWSHIRAEVQGRGTKLKMWPRGSCVHLLPPHTPNTRSLDSHYGTKTVITWHIMLHSDL